MKIQQQNQELRQMKIHNIKNEQHKNLLEVLPSKYHRWEFLAFDFKKIVFKYLKYIIII